MNIVKIHDWGTGKTEYYCFSNSARAENQCARARQWFERQDKTVDLYSGEDVHINESILPGEEWKT